jgi:[ribosomal protein S5]-alanine N-acetyltransferase
MACLGIWRAGPFQDNAAQKIRSVSTTDRVQIAHKTPEVRGMARIWMGLASPLLWLSLVIRPHPSTAELLRTDIAIASHAPVSDDWRVSPPVLRGRMATLRELRIADAPALHALVASEAVSRFVAPAPGSAAAFERFIERMRSKRREGSHISFAIVPNELDAAAGLFQIRRLHDPLPTAEWGFALAPAYWGTGMFVDAARLAARFVFDWLRVDRLEARAAMSNGRGTAALRKLGAVHEATLRRAVLRNGEYVDQGLWSILKTDWGQAHHIWRPDAHVH